ncbi:MAG: DUF167 domain-containing protein [candidate division NC10 bacterium]|nr:DUF167 domain-containing protein [candidate division NC10 bacterium]
MDPSTLNLHTRGADLLLSVLVKPGARRDEIIGVQEGFLKVSVSAPPVEGKANAACRRLLADVLRVPISRVEVVAGSNTPRKRIRIRNADLATLRARLASFLK